jgi:D-cysteine desulfhydrase
MSVDQEESILKLKETLLLFDKFPALKNKVPWVKIGEFPTPIQKLTSLGEALGIPELYCKRDDLTHREYGGNKVRNLEFILGDAKRLGRELLLTLGTWGSNQIMAAAFFAGKHGMKSVCVMLPQAAQEYARNNLLIVWGLGSELCFADGNVAAALKLGSVYLRHWLNHERPYFVWPGGSSPLGTLGYVNAGLEIAEQVRHKVMPEPDFIFCAVGSLGTFVGLILGIKLAGLKTKVMGVRVYDKLAVNYFLARRLAQNTLKIIRTNDPSIPEPRLSASDFIILHDYFGRRYASSTKRGLEAVSLAKDLEGLKLDVTYTGKALSAIINLARKSKLKNKVALFHNSYNSRPLESLIPVFPSWQELPREFHHCFMGEILGPED